jgi:hypothetical protein
MPPSSSPTPGREALAALAAVATERVSYSSMTAGVDVLGYGLTALACSILVFAGVALLVGGPDLQFTAQALGLLGGLCGVLASVFMLAAVPALSLLQVLSVRESTHDVGSGLASGETVNWIGLAALVCCAAALLGARMALRAPLLGALLIGLAAIGMFALVSRFEVVAAPLGVSDRGRDYLGLIARLAVFAVIPWLVGLPMAMLGGRRPRKREA